MLFNLFVFLMHRLFGSKEDQRKLAEDLAELDRLDYSMRAEFRANMACIDRSMIDINERLFPRYRDELNKRRAATGLPPI